MFCPDCGSEVAEGRNFCGKCGGQLRAASGSAVVAQDIPETLAVAVSPTPRPPVSMRQKLMYAGLGLLVALGGVGWWWFHRPAPAYKVQDPGIYPFSVWNADSKSQKYGFLDADGKVLIQPQWDFYSASFVLDGQYVGCNEGLCGVRKDGKWGYIDTGGHLVIPTQFDLASQFFEGLARVKLGNQVGFIDKTGQYAINPQFNEAGYFHGGLAPVRTDDGWGFVNKTGAFVIKPRFQDANYNGFSQGLAAVSQGKWGYIDQTGAFAIKPQFDAAGPFSEGMAPVMVNNKWGYINTTGEIVINPQFDERTGFSGGLAAVRVSGHSGTINKQGRYVVNPGQYDMKIRDGGLVQVTTGDGVGLMTRDGNWVVKPSKALTGVGGVMGKVFYGEVSADGDVEISISGKVLAGPYKGAMLDTLAQDIDNENSARQAMQVLVNAEASYSAAHPVKGFTASIQNLGPATGNPDENHAGLIDADLATGTKDGYQFTVSIPAGTSTGRTNFNYYLEAKPTAGHAGRTYCVDSSGVVGYNAQCR